MTRDRDRPRVIVAIDTDEGITGWGECYNHGPDWALPPLLDYLYLQIQGYDPRRIEFLILKLLQHQRFPPGALGLAAISAIDHALWDISAKAVNLPVYMLLGGDIGGIAVHLAARIMALAGAGDVLVSRTLTDLVVGSGITFEDRGVHELKGIPGPRQVSRLVRIP